MILEKVSKRDVVLILFLLIGLFVSVWINQSYLIFGFVSILITSLTFLYVNPQKTSKTLVKLNRIIQGAFIITITLLFIIVLIKTALSIFLGNLLGLIILEQGNDVFRLIMIVFSFVGVIISVLNIRSGQKLKKGKKIL